MSPRRKYAVIVRDDRAALQPGSVWWAYLRVSLGEKQDIASQRRPVQEFADRHGATISRWWIDDHVSGSSVEDRHAFDQMIETAKREPGACAGVLVWNLARWARNDLESQYYRADLRLHGYAVVSVSDDIPSGDLGLIMEALLDFKNRKYLEDLSKDTRRGLRDTVLREVEVDGKTYCGFSGGGFPPRGYRAKQVETGRRRNGEPRINAVWEIDPKWQERVAQARRMFAEGEPAQKIHNECGLFRSLSAYRDFFRCVTYAGVRKCGEVTVLGAHPAYDDAGQRARIEARLLAQAERYGHRPRTKVAHMLSGLAFCGACSAVLHGHGHPDGDYYICARARKDCTASRVLCRILDSQVVASLAERVFTGPALSRLVEAINAERAKGDDSIAGERTRLQREQRRLAKELAELVRFIRQGHASQTVAEEIARLEHQAAANEAHLRAIAAQEAAARPLAVTEEQLTQLAAELQERLRSEDKQRVWALVRACVGRVEVTGAEARVYPRFGGLFQGENLAFSSYPQPDGHESLGFPVDIQCRRGRRHGPLPLTPLQIRVQRLRAERLCFREIGEQLGITAQAAWETYHRARRQA